MTAAGIARLSPLLLAAIALWSVGVETLEEITGRATARA
jgi:hypothetical protein